MHADEMGDHAAVGSRGYAAMERLLRADAIEDAWSELCSFLDALGFNRLLYVATYFSGRSGMGDAGDALILSNYPDDYMRAYVDGGMFRHAPMVRWAARNVGATSWRMMREEAEAGRLSAEELEVMRFNARHGLRSGYAIAFPRWSPRAAFGIGLGSTGMSQDRVDAFWKIAGRDVETVCLAAHLKFLSLPDAARRGMLTARQREVLELIADGKTVADVATVIGRTPATVEKHLRLARDALNVDTTAQAVLKAALRNQIFVAPDI